MNWMDRQVNGLVHSLGDSLSIGSIDGDRAALMDQPKDGWWKDDCFSWTADEESV